MIISPNQELYRSAVVLIGIIVVIGSCCRNVQGSLNDADNNDEEPTTTNELWSQDDNEGLQRTDAPAKAGTVNDKDDFNVNSHLNEKTFSHYFNVSQYPAHLCTRVCKRGERRVCHIEFTLEYYQAMGVACGNCLKGNEKDCNNPQCITGDGVEKGVMSINRQVPGPAIQVCKDDLIIVDVVNLAVGSAASIHWHGLHMIETPFMDGVPFVTQCPIDFSTIFRYEFEATEPGTQFYHSHSGLHKINGQYGALIIRQPQEIESLKNYYDHDLPEHYILISDWMHWYGEQLFPGHPSSHGIFPDSVLINGRGVHINPQTGEQTKVPPKLYTVTASERYRFRIINAASHACPFQFQIQDHTFSVMASDSFNVVPREFDTLTVNSGERYDIIVNANHTGGSFWIRVRGLGICATNPTESVALLKYKTNKVVDPSDDFPRPPLPRYEDPYSSKVNLNHPNATCRNKNNDVCITELSSLEEDAELRYAVPDHKFFLGFQNILVPNEEIFKPGQYYHFSNIARNITVVGVINKISMTYPSYPPLTQPWNIDESQFCDDLNLPAKCAGKDVCACVHRLKVKHNSIVELIIVDESESIGLINHPFHLHGHRFMVPGMGQHPFGLPMTVQLAKQMEYKRMLPRGHSNARPPFKDTVSIPSRGYAIVRFRATNPGFWLMHCHYEWHSITGMDLVVQVGTTDQMVKAPHGFPRCGNYVPPVRRRHFKNF